MKCYRLLDDEAGEWFVVEAPSISAAIEAWKAHVIADLKARGDYEPGNDDLEPGSVELLSDAAVIRAENSKMGGGGGGVSDTEATRRDQSAAASRVATPKEP